MFSAVPPLWTRGAAGPGAGAPLYRTRYFSGNLRGRPHYCFDDKALRGDCAAGGGRCVFNTLFHFHKYSNEKLRIERPTNGHDSGKR
ncbi:hypothetical protein EVAR_52887_1 [Eumeta japonica]|uniref:Uncharacterized protein n=1 Tax=Eumeta variegata TaxID=151549 RepID=A0A4C1YMA3_EUMVA|nr:hypothetical protein EVAR_52887_1 [Eumeta japonica]